MTEYYKFLTEDNKGAYSEFDFTEYLPVNGKPGKWLQRIENIRACESGYHACEKKDVIEWLNSKAFIVELRDVENAGNKVVAKEMRFVKHLKKWDDKNARLAACDIAESVIHIWKKYYPDDNRPQEAIRISRLFAKGKATKQQMAAARDAAWAAAWAAAWDAAGDANFKIICKYMGI